MNSGHQNGRISYGLLMRVLNGLFALVLMSPVLATGTYQEPDEFLDEVFAGDVPTVSKLWLDKALQEKVRAVMGHEYGSLRLSYWQRGERTAWILEEIGKSLPITAGIVVNRDRVEVLRILVFRESRGWEVRYPFFTDQFTDIRLDDRGQLDRGIDGISGATLSVNAVKKLAALALLFHQEVNE